MASKTKLRPRCRHCDRLMIGSEDRCDSEAADFWGFRSRFWTRHELPQSRFQTMRTIPPSCGMGFVWTVPKPWEVRVLFLETLLSLLSWGMPSSAR